MTTHTIPVNTYHDPIACTTCSNPEVELFVKCNLGETIFDEKRTEMIKCTVCELEGDYK